MDRMCPVLRPLHWPRVPRISDYKILLLVYEAKNGSQAKYSSDLQPVAYFLSLESKPNKEKQHLVLMPQTSGTNSQGTADQLLHSVVLNQDWRPFYCNCTALHFSFYSSISYVRNSLFILLIYKWFLRHFATFYMLSFFFNALVFCKAVWIALLLEGALQINPPCLAHPAWHQTADVFCRPA